MLPYCATNHGLRKPEGAYRGDGYYNTLLSPFCQPLFYRNFQKSAECRDYITSLTKAEPDELIPVELERFAEGRLSTI